MDDRSPRSRKPAFVFLLPVFLLLAGANPPEARAQSMAMAAKGQKIFFKVCVQCHTLQTKNQASGPGLAGVLERVPSEDWLMQWLKNPEKLLKNGDSYAQKISDDYPLDMPQLKVMQNPSNRKAILVFLKQMRAQNRGSQ
jgi:mono/diheme cytochrome c family protein